MMVHGVLAGAWFCICVWSVATFIGCNSDFLSFTALVSAFMFFFHIAMILDDMGGDDNET